MRFVQEITAKFLGYTWKLVYDQKGMQCLYNEDMDATLTSLGNQQNLNIDLGDGHVLFMSNELNYAQFYVNGVIVHPSKHKAFEDKEAPYWDLLKYFQNWLIES